MAATWEVSGTTATYKNDAGQVVAKITGLKDGLKAKNGEIDGITVTEGASGGTGTISLNSNVLKDSDVKLTLSNGGKYQLGLASGAAGFTPSNVTADVSNGKLTLKGNLSAGYKIKNSKEITYSKALDDATLAEVTGLNTELVKSTSGEISIETTTGEEPNTVTTFTKKVTISDDVITLNGDALTNKNVKLTNKNGADYVLDLNDYISPQFDDNGTWEVKSGKASYSATLGAGHVLSLDGLSVTYLAAQESATKLFTISNVSSTATEDDFEVAEINNKNYAAKITLGPGALTNKNVTINGTGYQLALDENVSKDGTTATNLWNVSNTTATYKNIIPAYYTYEASDNSVIYTKQKDIKTLATVSNLVKGLTVGTDTYDATENPNGTGNSALYANEGEDLAVRVTNSGVITVYADALNKKNVTLKNGTDESYSLAVGDGITAPGVDSEAGTTWKVSGTTATLNGKTTEGYAASNDTTIAYVANNKSVALATIKGLGKGVSVSKGEVSEDDKGKVGVKGKDSSGEATFTEGLALNASNENEIIVSKNVLGTSNVTLTPYAGYTYSLVLDDGEDYVLDGGKVPIQEETKTFWYNKGSGLLLKGGTAKYYRLTNSTTITETDEVVGSDLATVTGLKTNLTPVDGDIDGITVKNSVITLSSKVLNNANVAFNSNGGNYQFALADSALQAQPGTMWRVSGTEAILQYYIKTAGYEYGDNNKSLTYTTGNPSYVLATISGLKSGLKAVNGKIDGIADEAYIRNNSYAEKSITLSKNVLGTTDITLSDGDEDYGYKLVLDETEDTGVTPITVTSTWSASNGTVTYKVTPDKAGYVQESDDKIAYKKKTAVKTTISGLNKDLSASDAASITGITGPNNDGVITLSESALGGKNATLKNASGGTYTLALDNVDPPTLKADPVWAYDSKSKTKANLTGVVTNAGYEVSADALSVLYTPATNVSTNPDNTSVLASITGVKSGLTSDALNEGITKRGSVLTLGASVLGGTKLAVTGPYTLALGDGVSTEAKDDIAWVTNGTTATFKTYKTEYYTLDAKETSVKYTKATAGTTHATIKGIAKDVNINRAYAPTNSNDKAKGGEVKLTADMLGASNVTLTGNGFKLSLASAVPTTAKPATEWITSGTTATYKDYEKAYYHLDSDNKITYFKPTSGTPKATIKGIASGATIADSDMTTSAGKTTVTLNDSQLAGKNVTISGVGYTLALGEVSEKAEDGDIWWEQAKNASSATLKQAVSKGYALSDSKTAITYSSKETTPTLATVSGITKNTSGEAISTREASVPTTINGISAISASKEITVSSTDFGSDKNGAKVTLKSDDYTFAIGDLTPVTTDGNPTWTLNKSKGTATYNQAYTTGYALTNDKTITYTAATTTPLATISGLDKNKLKNLEGVTWEGNESVFSSLDDYGIAIDETDTTKINLTSDDLLGTSTIKLGKKDNYTFDVSEIAPEAGSKTWSIKGTTATYSATTTAGYKTNDTANSVSYVKPTVDDAIVTISGLKKGLKTDGTNVGVETKTTEDDGEGGTVTVKSISKGIILVNPKEIDLSSDVLGTTSIKLTNGTGSTYKFATIGASTPSNDQSWSFSKGTATYKDIQTGGFTLETDGVNLTYTAPKTTTLATVKGLNKNFVGDLSSSLLLNGETITVNQALLGTSKVTLTLPKNSSKIYSLAIGDAPTSSTEDKLEWVTSGTTATYKKYNTAYYKLDATSTSINYVAATKGTTYATVTGLKSGATISTSTDFSGDETGGTIKLSAKHLGVKDVKVTVPSSNKSAEFKLSLVGDAPTSEAKNTTEWVTSGTTAVYKTYDKGYFSINDKGVAVYKKGTNPTGTEFATIKGANGDITATFGTGSNANNFMLIGSELSNKIEIASVLEDPTDTDSAATKYGFHFTNTYNNAEIKGSKNDDTITILGDRLTVTGGKGNDTITLEDDATRAGNLIVYAKGDGDDTVVNFSENDSISVPKNFSYSGGGEITVGTNTITLELYGDPSSITINNKSYSTDSSYYSNDLLADDNYSIDAAQLNSIVEPASIGLTPYDINSGLNLTKEDVFTAAVTYAKDK